MSLFKHVDLVRSAQTFSTRYAAGVGISTPFSESTLQRVIVSDLAGLSQPPTLTRAQAMTVPAVAKARSLILGSLGRQPLALYRDADVLDPAPWMYRSDTVQSPITRMCGTLDDLLFYGTSLWAVERDDNAMIVDAIRLPYEYWDVTRDGQIEATLDPTIAKTIVTPESVILFEGLQEGLLTIGARTLSAAIDLETAWARRVDTPIPMLELHETERDSKLTDEDAQDYVEKWNQARRGSATGFTPYGLEARVHGNQSTDLFIEGRNALRLDVALFTSIPSSLLEGSQASASLTYSTQEGRRNELIDYSLSFWAAAIEARLSMDDVTPPGTRIGFDVSYYTSPTQPQQYPATKD